MGWMLKAIQTCELPAGFTYLQSVKAIARHERALGCAMLSNPDFVLSLSMTTPGPSTDPRPAPSPRSDLRGATAQTSDATYC